MAIAASNDARHDRWWNYYLAYHASTPRNAIECAVEPLQNPPGERIQIIDLHPPLENYPLADMNLWWLIICLDGAPERMKHAVNCGQTPQAAHDWLAPAEEQFRRFIAAEVQQLPTEPTVLLQGDWRDGDILGFATLELAEVLVRRVADRCAEANQQANLPWTEQFHVRAGIGLTVGEAFTGLGHADTLHIIERDAGQTCYGNKCTVVPLVPAAA